jgi:hypothetical protein
MLEKCKKVISQRAFLFMVHEMEGMLEDLRRDGLNK